MTKREYRHHERKRVSRVINRTVRECSRAVFASMHLARQLRASRIAATILNASMISTFDPLDQLDAE